MTTATAMAAAAGFQEGVQEGRGGGEGGNSPQGGGVFDDTMFNLPRRPDSASGVSSRPGAVKR